MSASRELLSRHVCEARFTGYEDSMDPMLRVHPPRPARKLAVFSIEKYLDYEKPGEYGDGRAERFTISPDECADAAIATTLASLSPGDRVKLAWNHDYVTRTDEGGGVIKSPERPVVLLEKLESSASGQPAFDADPVHAQVHYAQEVNGVVVGR